MDYYDVLLFDSYSYNTLYIPDVYLHYSSQIAISAIQNQVRVFLGCASISRCPSYLSVCLFVDKGQDFMSSPKVKTFS